MTGLSTPKALPIAGITWLIYFYLFAKVGDSFPMQGGTAPGTLMFPVLGVTLGFLNIRVLISQNCLSVRDFNEM
jgi:hypothetical protein